MLCFLSGFSSHPSTRFAYVILCLKTSSRQAQNLCFCSDVQICDWRMSCQLHFSSFSTVTSHNMDRIAPKFCFVLSSKSHSTVNKVLKKQKLETQTMWMYQDNSNNSFLLVLGFSFYWDENSNTICSGLQNTVYWKQVYLKNKQKGYKCTSSKRGCYVYRMSCFIWTNQLRF